MHTFTVPRQSFKPLTVTHGKGRVFYATFAHAPSTWDHPKVQEMYLEAIKWSLGEIDADVTPIPVPSAPSAALPPAKPTP